MAVAAGNSGGLASCGDARALVPATERTDRAPIGVVDVPSPPGSPPLADAIAPIAEDPAGRPPNGGGDAAAACFFASSWRR